MRDHKPTAIKECFKTCELCAEIDYTQSSASHTMTKHKVLQTIYCSSFYQLSILRQLYKITFKATFKITFKFLVAGLLATGSLLACEMILNRSAIAQQISPQLRQYFLSDPLATTPRDPFLPQAPIDRPLSPLELSALSANLDELNATAQQLLAAGQTDAAFLLWRRELRLRRVLGPIEEFNTIIRVAQLAWEAQRPIEVQLLTLRTRKIWETLQAALGVNAEEEAFEEVREEDGSEPARVLVSGQTADDIAALNTLAQTFTLLRDVDSATEVYEQIIALSSRQGVEPTAQRRSLAELHLQWFQFAKAADIYLALLQTARASGDQAAEVATLERLIYSYQQADAIAFATRAQTDLLRLYQARQAEDKLPQLLLAIAQNYRTLNLPSSAIAYYRSAYSAAQRFEQFSYSAQVLKDLGALYQSLALNEQALGAYTLLVPVEQQAYNDYGVMQAYNRIGQLQRRLGNSLEALKAFEQARAIANRLGLDPTYFIEQIESVT